MRSQRRPTWDELPRPVRAGVEDALGGQVVAARSIQQGLTPGLASRLVLDDGRRVFAKAAGVARGEEVVAKLRQEARVLAALPRSVPAPRRIADYDDGRWVAVLSTDIEGLSPSWTRTDVDRVVSAVTTSADALTPNPVAAPRFVDDWAADLTGWRQLAANSNVRLPDVIDPWAGRNRELLATVEAVWPQAADGQTLLHGDLRTGNILLADGQVWLVDWASACVGAPWLDLVFLLPSTGLGPADMNTLTKDVDPDALTAMVAAVAGFLITVGMEPPPWYAPGIRTLQLAEAAAAVGWLKQRVGAS